MFACKKGEGGVQWDVCVHECVYAEAVQRLEFVRKALQDWWIKKGKKKQKNKKTGNGLSCSHKCAFTVYNMDFPV